MNRVFESIASFTHSIFTYDMFSGITDWKTWIMQLKNQLLLLLLAFIITDILVAIVFFRNIVKDGKKYEKKVKMNDILIRLLKYGIIIWILSMLTLRAIILLKAGAINTKLILFNFDKFIFLYDSKVCLIPTGIVVVVSLFLLIFTQIKKRNYLNKIYKQACIKLDNSNKQDLITAVNELEKIIFWKDSKKLVDETKKKIQEVKNDEIYTSALNLAKNYRIDDFKKAIALLKKIPSWKDSSELILAFSENIKTIENDNAYDNAQRLARTNIISNMKQAIDIYKSIIAWKDSKKQIEILKDRIQKKEIEIKNDEIYSKSVNLIKKDDYESLKVARDLLNSIANWKDSKKLIEKTNARIKKIEDDYNSKYEQAELLMNSECIENIEKSMSIFKQIANWHNSKDQIEICRNLIIRLKEKAENDRKQKLYNEAVEEAKKDTIEAYQNAVKTLAEVKDWQDADNLIKIFNQKIEQLKQKELEDRNNKIYNDAIEKSKSKTIVFTNVFKYLNQFFL